MFITTLEAINNYELGLKYNLVMESLADIYNIVQMDGEVTYENQFISLTFDEDDFLEV